MVGGQSILSSSEEEGEGEGEREVRWRKKRGERKKNNNMHSYNNRAYLQGYYNNCAFMHNFITPTNVDVFLLLSKCAYLNTFSILHYFTFTNASALTRLKSTISRFYQMPENNNLKLSSL